MNEVAIIARIVKRCVVYDPKVQQMVPGYELEVLGRGHEQARTAGISDAVDEAKAGKPEKG